GWTAGFGGSMHRHQVAHTDELVQLDVVHVPVLSPFGRMQDDKHVVVVGVHLWDTVTLHCVLHGHRVKTEHLREHTHCRVVPGGDVHPHETVLALKQQRQLLDATLLNPTLSNEANVHSTHIPQPCCRAVRLGFRAVTAP